MSTNKNILINNGIIYSNSHLNLIPFLSTSDRMNSKKKVILNINSKRYHIKSGTLLIIMEANKEFLTNVDSFDIKKNYDLVIDNQFLLFNGDWWVNFQGNKEELILKKEFNVLTEFNSNEEKVATKEVLEIEDKKKEEV